jgi:hypothetical protein
MNELKFEASLSSGASLLAYGHNVARRVQCPAQAGEAEMKALVPVTLLLATAFLVSHDVLGGEGFASQARAGAGRPLFPWQLGFRSANQ